MEVVTIDIRHRERLGRNTVKHLRDEGFMPGVLYGGGRDSLAIALHHEKMKTHLRHHRRVYKLNMDGKEQAGYLKDVQWDTLTDEPLHVDLQRIEMDQPLKLQVQIAYLGHPKGLAKGGRFVQDMDRIHLACLPASIPEALEVRVEDIDLGDKIQAKDLDLPEGCQLDVSPDATVCHMPIDIIKEAPEPDPDAPAEGDEAAPTPETPGEGS